MKSAVYFLLLFAVACRAATPTTGEATGEAATTSPDSGDDSERASATSATGAEDHLPPPFTAAELREGLPAGTELQLRIEAQGQPAVVQHWVFTAADASGCTIAARILADDGAVIRDEGEGTSTWRELESHAYFPAARSTRREAKVEVPAGTFDSWLYEVEPAKAGGPRQLYYFARSMPGPPVLVETLEGDSVVMRMALVSRSQPAP